MRKILFCCFAFYPASTQAQQPKFLLGVNAASVWNSYSFTKEIYPFVIKNRMNFSSGIQAKYSLNKRFYIDAQVNYATKDFGYTLNQRVDPSSHIPEYTIKQNYIEVPLSINYFFVTEKPVSFFCSLGLVNSFFISAKYDGDDYPVYGAQKYKPYLLSVKSGGGVLFSLGNNFFGSAELYSNIYLDKIQYLAKGNPFQLALGFSVLKKLGSKKISTN